MFELARKHLDARYIYEAEELPVAVAAPMLPDRAKLAALPAELRDQLEQALKRLDDDAIEIAIGEIYAHDRVLAENLSTLTRRFEYDPILALLHDED